ncbi:peptidase M48 [Spirochaetia bacterium]|nr:peptidase M48 [Spirochaetia bacterium]
MKAFLFSILLGIAAFSVLPAQSGRGGGSARDPGGGLSDALSQMDSALSQANDDISSEDAYFLGRAVAANILSRYRLYTQKPAAARYLNQICAAITANSPMPDVYNGYHVAILDSPELNAFATTGGHIFVCRGLMEAVATEDALAAVLAHEIAHIQLSHGVELIKNMRLTQELSNTADRAAGIAAREAGLNRRKVLFDNSVREMVTTLIVNGYTHKQEFEADTYALGLLAGAGYFPGSMVDVLTILQKRGSPSGAGGAHPQPAQRITNVQRDQSRYQVQDTRSFRAVRFAGSLR